MPISLPTLVIGFELDVLVRAKLTREVADAIREAQYAVLTLLDWLAEDA